MREFLKNERFEKIHIAVHKDWEEYLKDLPQVSFYAQDYAK